MNVNNLVLSLFLTGRFQLYKLQAYQYIYGDKYNDDNKSMIVNSTVALGYVTLKYTPNY